MSNNKKIVPCLDMKGGRVVKGIQFENIRDAGDPVEFARYYEAQGADELVFLDITATVEKRKTMTELAKKVADAINIPFCVGGGIASMEDVKAVLDAGADKVSLNSAAVKNPTLLSKIAQEYGKERLVCAIDGKRVYVQSEAEAPGKNVARAAGKLFWFDVLTHGGTKSTGNDAIAWAKEAANLGAGEILPTSKDFDGVKGGYDLEMTRMMKEISNVQITASGGAGTMEHILEAFTLGKADAALAASIFHFREILIPDLKEFLRNHGISVRL